jgi:hypothetical protein
LEKQNKAYSLNEIETEYLSKGCQQTHCSFSEISSSCMDSLHWGKKIGVSVYQGEATKVTALVRNAKNVGL